MILIKEFLKFLWYGFSNPLSTTMEDPKNTKDDKKEKASTELKEELTEDELKGVDGGGHDRMGMGGGHLLQE